MPAADAASVAERHIGVRILVDHGVAAEVALAAIEATEAGTLPLVHVAAVLEALAYEDPKLMTSVGLTLANNAADTSMSRARRDVIAGLLSRPGGAMVPGAKATTAATALERVAIECWLTILDASINGAEDASTATTLFAKLASMFLGAPDDPARPVPSAGVTPASLTWSIAGLVDWFATRTWPMPLRMRFVHTTVAAALNSRSCDVVASLTIALVRASARAPRRVLVTAFLCPPSLLPHRAAPAPRPMPRAFARHPYLT